MVFNLNQELSKSQVLSVRVAPCFTLNNQVEYIFSFLEMLNNFFTIEFHRLKFAVNQVWCYYKAPVLGQLRALGSV